MKKLLLSIISLLLTTTISSQTGWNTVWELKQAPFRPANSVSEYAKVLAGLDTDQDGWGEFITGYTDLDSNFIFMYEATGDDTYELVWYYKIPFQANSYFALAVGDVDHNDKPEIILGIPVVITTEDPDPPLVFTFEWNGVQGENKYGTDNGDGTFSTTSETRFGIASGVDWRPYSMTVEDIDKDGDNELIVGNRQDPRGVLVASVTGGELSVFGQWVTEYYYENSEGGSNYCTTTGDLDNDGNTDIIELVWNMYTLRLFEVTGPDTYEYVNGFETIFTPFDYGAVDGVRIVDANGDGKNEMLHAGTESRLALFLIQDISDLSELTPEDIVEFYHPPVAIKPNGEPVDAPEIRNMDAGDPDHDGKMNLLVCSSTNGQIWDIEYKGEGDLADSSSWNFSIVYDAFANAASAIGDSAASTLTPRLYYGSIAEDMDGDGKSEFVFVNYSTDKEIWMDDIYVSIIEADNATSVEPVDKLIPKSLELNQNYPNPFNPSTIINFSVPENSGHVKLAVYDILGRVITTLVDEKLRSGNYNVEFNAIDLPSGIYMYRLTTDSHSRTMKMILQK